MPATSTGASAASTASDGVVYTGFGQGSAATTTAASSNDGSGSSAATRLVINMGEMYGLGLIATGIFFGFSIML